MKINKIFYILFLSMFFISNSYALNIGCFKETDSVEVNNAKTIKIKLNSGDSNIFFLQDNTLLPYKFYSATSEESINYQIKSTSSGDRNQFNNINDNNPNTNFSFGDSASEKTIVIDLLKEYKPGTIYPNFNFVHNGIIKYYISSDGNNFGQTSEEDITFFAFRYLKLSFTNFTNDNKINKTIITDIIINKNPSLEYLVNPIKSGSVLLYSTFDCEFDSIKEQLVKYKEASMKANFSIDSSTKEFDINFKINPKYNNDFDGDGVFNPKDNCKYVYNKDQSDIDKDGIGDLCDYDNKTKNPTEGDIDKDGVGNNHDNCKYFYNPDQKDSNGDGIGDMCADDDNDGITGKFDNCPNVANQDQKDININNIGDACEFDKDNDGVFDSVDNCINNPNPDQKDTDSDSIGDTCDNCKLFNPDQKDSNNNGAGDTCEDESKYVATHDKDGDGKLDSLDNCPNIANVNQADLDKDGVGDTCDNCLSIQNSDQTDEDKNGVGDICEDSDNDGIDGYKDNCPNIANADQKDSNNNGIGDVCEDNDGDGIINSLDNCPYAYNIDQKDVDGDKIGNTCDQKDDRFVESNKLFFIGLMAIIISIFVFGIFAMVKKLKTNG